MVNYDKSQGAPSAESAKPALDLHQGPFEGPQHRLAVLLQMHSALRVGELKRIAYRDDVTGLKNRAALYNEDIPKYDSRAKRQGSLYHIAMVDLDGLKKVNDRAGHAVGDEYLREFGRAMKQSVRPTDEVYRLGGDEFIVVVEDVPKAPEESEDLRDALRQRLINNMLVTAQTIPVLQQAQESKGVQFSASIGIVPWNPTTQQFEVVLEDADSAMYQHKHGSATTDLIK